MCFMSSQCLLADPINIIFEVSLTSTLSNTTVCGIKYCSCHTAKFPLSTSGLFHWSRFLAEVLLFGPEVTKDLARVCINVVAENIDDGPIGRISVDHDVAIRHVLPELCHHAAKPCKNGKFTLYDTALVLKRVKHFSAKGSILDIVIDLCVPSLIRIIQVISRSNILINIRLLGVRFQVFISIFPSSSSGDGNNLGLLRSYAFFSIARLALWT